MDAQGLYRWAGNRPRLEDDIRLSLASRNEDEAAAVVAGASVYPK
jgi:hypothetical protein